MYSLVKLMNIERRLQMTYSLILKNINLKVESLKDLPKLKQIMEINNITPNFSKLARELGVDRRTVKKHYNGFEKSKTRKKLSKVDKYKNILNELLNDNSIQRFYSKSVLYRYLKDNYGLEISESNFRNYINKNQKYKEYFDKKKGQTKAKLRFETSAGEEAQIDWKENIEFKTKDGQIITINILVFELSYSRYRLFHVSESKSQEVLLDFLTQSFEMIGGTPKYLVTDNMKTVMDKARSKISKGKVNNKFSQYLKDFSLEIKPCMARRPQTKGKVESSMKLLEDIHAYQGRLDYKELLELIEKLNNRVNINIHQGTNKIPIKLLETEKDLLNPLPRKKIRDLYKISKSMVKVNSSNMITFKGNQYSIPNEYANTILTIEALDNKLYIYHNTKLITIHEITNKKLNYKYSDYEELVKLTWKNKNIEEIRNIASMNLKKLGEIYGK